MLKDIPIYVYALLVLFILSLLFWPDLDMPNQSDVDHCSGLAGGNQQVFTDCIRDRVATRGQN